MQHRTNNAAPSDFHSARPHRADYPICPPGCSRRHDPKVTVMVSEGPQLANDGIEAERPMSEPRWLFVNYHILSPARCL